MAEAFGIAAGAITVVETCVKFTSKCKHLIETAHDAPKELRHIFIEISSLKDTLESLSYLSNADCDFSDSVKSITQIDGAVDGCRSAVEALATELDSLAIADHTKGEPGKRQRLKGLLTWCLKESKAHKLLEQVVQHKSTISLALLGEITQDVKDIKYSTDKLRDVVDESTRWQICSWLETINPTQDHNMASSLRENNTCTWLLRHPHWKDWIGGADRFIWVHGIPGAGKTIFASYAISQIINSCPSNQVENLCVYFYCSYRQTEDQITGFLRWVVGQLCRKLKRTPEVLVDLYHQNSYPNLAHLKYALQSLLSGLNTCYVVLDAVDECNPRADLLNLLKDLLSNPAFEKIKLLMTSRLYPDIQAVLQPPVVPISMSNELVEEDIKRYVDHEIRGIPKKKLWTRSLIADAVKTIAHGAKGMFRWAACQLYLLKRMRSEAEIRESFTTMPESLDEMYERILNGIPTKDRPHASAALAWICVHESAGFHSGIPARLLNAAVFPKKNTATVHDIHEICHCLIRIDNMMSRYRGHISDESTKVSHDMVALAHYSVKEFLFSGRLSNNAVLSRFNMTSEGLRQEVILTALNHCIETPLDKEPGLPFDNFETYCRELILQSIISYEDDFLKEKLWTSLRLFLMDHPHPLKPILSLEKNVHWSCLGSEPTTSWKLRDNSDSIHTRLCLAFCNLMIHGSSKLAAKLLEGRDVESAFCAILVTTPSGAESFHGNVLQSFMSAWTLRSRREDLNLLKILQHHLDPELWLIYYTEAHTMMWGCCEGATNYLSDLLKDGFNYNPSRIKISPIQMAVYRWDNRSVELFLQHGADANQIGNPTGKDISRLDTSWHLCSPLHIVRNCPYSLGNFDSWLKKHGRIGLKHALAGNRPYIEWTLLAHGAEDFVLDTSGKRIYEGSKSPVIKGNLEEEGKEEERLEVRESEQDKVNNFSEVDNDEDGGDIIFKDPQEVSLTIPDAVPAAFTISQSTKKMANALTQHDGPSKLI